MSWPAPRDCFTKEAREHLAQIRAAMVTQLVPVYALEFDQNVEALTRFAFKYGFTLDVTGVHR